MKSKTMAARLVGALFLIAMVASLLGGVGFIEPVLSAPGYLASASENETQVMIGVLLELLNAIAVLGIGVLMFPIFRPHNESIATGYLGRRIIESVFCSFIVISPLSLIALGRDYVNAGAVDASLIQALGALSIAGRESVANLLIPVFLGLGALLFYGLLYKTRLLPRCISIWGFIGAVLMLALNMLITFNLDIDMSIGMLFVLPIITNEIFLGIWLVAKGFNPAAIASGFAKQG